GGGIRNDGGAVFLNFVGVLGNRAGENGGGIENDRGDFQIFHSFVRHNSAARCGGGIDNAVGGSTLFVHYTGVTDNTAELAGGGIANRGRPGTPVTTASLEFLLTLSPYSAPRGRDVLNTTFATFAGLAGAPADKIGDLLDNVTEEHVCHPTAIHH
ncbi:MAG: hypothetical protein JWL95_2239, partial [Gemmatimonadetes bacterium]|nr:hypothetical protein [Gemmatimonadota bacterium]